MLDIIPKPYELITVTQVLSSENGIVYDQVFTLTETITNIEGLTLTQVFSDGMMIISDTVGITESHVVYVKAIDAAGNESQSEKVHIWVAHEKKEEDEEDKEKKEEEGETATTLLSPGRSEPVAGVRPEPFDLALLPGRERNLMRGMFT